MGLFRKTYLGLMALVFIINFSAIKTHMLWILADADLGKMIQDRWDLVFLNVLFFGFFIILAHYRTRVDWRKKNIYIAFVIALFAEMYGFPLTAYFLSTHVGGFAIDYQPRVVMDFHLPGFDFSLTEVMLFGGALTTLGGLFVAMGWYQVYKGKGKLQTGGIYLYSRHPQYVGILLISLGWVIHWPTIPTLILFPAICVVYYRLARSEEKWEKGIHGSAFTKWKKKTPMFI